MDEPRLIRIFATTGAAGALLLGLAAALVVTGGAATLDEPMRRALDEPPGWLFASAGGLAFAGSVELTLVVLALLAGVLLFLGRPWGAVRVCTVAAGTAAMAFLGKALFERPRPPYASVFTNDFSFPSGHASIGAAVAVLLAWTALRHLRASKFLETVLGLALLWMVLNAFARLTLGVHYFTDVLGGVGLGLFVGGTGLASVTWSERWWRARRRPG